MKFKIHHYVHFVDEDHHHCHRRRHLSWTFGPVEEQTQFQGLPGVVTMDGATLKDTQKGKLKVTKLDAKGFPTDDDFDAPPSYTSSDSSIVSVDDQGLVVAGNPGVATISFNAANNGVPFSGAVEITVVPGDVAQVSISVGEIAEQ